MLRWLRKTRLNQHRQAKQVARTAKPMCASRLRNIIEFPPCWSCTCVASRILLKVLCDMKDVLCARCHCVFEIACECARICNHEAEFERNGGKACFIKNRQDPLISTNGVWKRSCFCWNFSSRFSNCLILLGFVWQSHHWKSSGRGKPACTWWFLPCQFTRKGSLTWLFQIGKEIALLFSYMSVDSSFVSANVGIDALLACCPPAAEQPRKQICRRPSDACIDKTVSLTAVLHFHFAFRQTVHVTKKSPRSQHSSCICIFSKGIQRREKGMGIREANHYRTDMPVHEHK